MEFNVNPRLGGWETAPLVDLHSQIQPTAEFLRREGIPIRCTNTTRELSAHIIREALAAGLAADGTLNVVILRQSGLLKGKAAFQAYVRGEFAPACAEDGRIQGTITECYPEELQTLRGSLYLGTRRIEAVLELCQTTPSHVYRAFKGEKLVLFNGPMFPILSDKRNLALLSAGAEKGLFDAAERETIRHYIPWTRQALPGRAEFRGDEMAMRDLLVTHRDELVLKEAASYGGKGVAIGAFTPEAPWRELVDAALARGDSVVQERLDSLPYLYQHGEYGASPSDIIWGPFLFGRTYGGLFLRMQPKAARNVVNLTQEASEGTAFEV